MTGEDSDLPTPITDPSEIERVAAEINVSPGQIEELTRYPRTDGTFLDDITLRESDKPKQPAAKLTFGDRLRRVFGEKKRH